MRNNKTLLKIAVGAFSMESNSFVSGETTLQDFKNQVYFQGESISRNCAGNASEFAGAWDVFTEAGCTLVPTLVATSSPRPPITEDALNEITRLIVSAIPTEIDAVYLMLHGAAWGHHEDDPEGALLEKVREKIGPKKLIAISLDLHAYFTEKMLRSVDIVSAYKTCPHLDLYETGARAANVLIRALNDEITPRTVMAEAPMITPPEHHDHTRAPFKPLMELTRNVEVGKVLIASMLATQPWLDVPELAWKAIVTVDGDIAHGSHVAQSLIDQAWAARHDFLSLSAKPVGQALKEALNTDSLSVIADIGDATNGGSYGDSTQVLREAIASQLKGSVILSVTDPTAVLLCQENLSGNAFSLAIASGPEGSYNQKTEIIATVKTITNKKIAYTHPAALNTIDDPGLAALIEVSHKSLNILLILHSNPVRVIDPAIYELFDLDLSQFDVLQAKSHVSFIAGFSKVTPNYILADTLGPTTADLKTLPFKKRPYPLYPFERI